MQRHPVVAFSPLNYFVHPTFCEGINEGWREEEGGERKRGGRKRGGRKERKEGRGRESCEY